MKLEEMTFEKALERLEEIVSLLERDNLSLEDSLRHFEEGVKLSKFCAAKLTEAEQRIDMIVETGEGAILKPFPAEELGE